MHIVIIAWLYVTLLMSLTVSNKIAGVAFFLFLGVAPVLLIFAIAVRRHRGLLEQQARRSGREQEVDAADDGQPKPD